MIYLNGLELIQWQSNSSNVADLIDKYINMPGASAEDIKELSIFKADLEKIKQDLQESTAQEKQAMSSKDYDRFEHCQKQTEALQ